MMQNKDIQEVIDKILPKKGVSLNYYISLLKRFGNTVMNLNTYKLIENNICEFEKVYGKVYPNAFVGTNESKCANFLGCVIDDELRKKDAKYEKYYTKVTPVFHSVITELNHLREKLVCYKLELISKKSGK